MLNNIHEITKSIFQKIEITLENILDSIQKIQNSLDMITKNTFGKMIKMIGEKDNHPDNTKKEENTESLETLEKRREEWSIIRETKVLRIIMIDITDKNHDHAKDQRTTKDKRKNSDKEKERDKDKGNKGIKEIEIDKGKDKEKEKRRDRDKEIDTKKDKLQQKKSKKEIIQDNILACIRRCQKNKDTTETKGK